MRIGIDANPIMRNRGGIGWHTYHLLRALIELKDDDTEYVAYIEPGTSDASVLQEGWAKSARIQWREVRRWLMGPRGRLDRLDLFHGPNFKLRTQGRWGAVVTIHDLWLDRFPQYSSKLFGQRRAFRRTRRTAWRARRVITVSDYSASDIVALCGLPRERIAVVYNAVSEDFRPVPQPTALARLQARHGWGTDRFILYVGGADPRKNHRVLVEAWATHASRFPAHTLVMVGPAVHRFGNINETVSQWQAERVISTGPLDVEDLKVLYAHADVFVFPSLYEGFGMPVLEAMACGAPVITSSTTSLPEVAGGAALLVEPNDAGQLGEQLAKLLTNDALRADLREKGFARARAFTWRQAAERTLAVYRDLVSSS